MILNALYVGVTDMNKSLNYYSKIFDREPVQREKRFSMFDLGGAYFGLFNAAYDGEDLRFGNNCVPNIQVDDIEAEYNRIKNIAPRVDENIRQAGAYRYFQFSDHDGNLVEFYSVQTIDYI